MNRLFLDDKNNIVLGFICLLAFVGVSFAGAPVGPTLDWEIDYGVSGSDVGSAVAIDSDNNILMAGSSGDGVNFLLAKFDTADGGDIWSHTYAFGGNSLNSLADVAVDSGDNVLVGGSTGGAGYLAKFSTDGSLLWQLGAVSASGVHSVAVDSGDSVVLSTFTSTYPTVIKYDLAGTLLSSWSATVLSSNQSHIAVDSNDNIILAAYYRTAPPPPFGFNSYIWKLDSDLNLVWETFYATTNLDIPAGLIVDLDDNIILVTKTSGMIVKYDDAGNLLDEDIGYTAAGGVGVDSLGQMIGMANAAPGDSEGIRGYNSNLNLQWIIAGFDNKILEDIVFDLDDNIVVAGTNTALSDVYLAKYVFPSTLLDIDIDVTPDTLNINVAKRITVYIAPPTGYLPEDINPTSLRLNGAEPLRTSIKHGNMVAKFNPQDLSCIGVGEAVELTLIGQLFNTTPIEGSDTIRIISKGK